MANGRWQNEENGGQNGEFSGKRAEVNRPWRKPKEGRRLNYE
jgi:hypothetical protein